MAASIQRIAESFDYDIEQTFIHNLQQQFHHKEFISSKSTKRKVFL